MRPLTKEARCAYQVDANPAAITVATTRALREATTPPTGPGVPLHQRRAAPPRGARGADRRGRAVPDRAARAGARADGRGDRPAARRGAVPGADLRRRRLARGRAGRGGAAGRAARGAGVRSRQIFAELPDPASALLRHVSGLAGVREDHRAQARPALPRRLPGRPRQRGRAVRDADRAEPAAHGPPLPARRRRAVRAARDAARTSREALDAPARAPSGSPRGPASAPRCARTPSS